LVSLATRSLLLKVAGIVARRRTIHQVDCFWAILHSSLLGGCRQMHRGNDDNFCGLIGSVVVEELAVLHAK
jgi:hypothetical protein